MVYEITHRSEVEYSGPVFLEPYLLRLRPRSDGSQRLHEFELRVEPEPAGRTEIADLDGNTVTRLWFNGTTDRFHVTTRSRVETLRENPWDYLVRSDLNALPLRYPEPQAHYLLPYRIPTGTSEPVARLAELTAKEADGQLVPFLSNLCDAVYQKIKVSIRDEGWPQPPEETLASGEGSCRDLALLYMDAARWMGFAARFVSGYQEGDPEQEHRYMHAWTEVYIPGAGWRGYDPTHGLAVADRHVAVAAAARPEEAAPTEGTYRGTGVTSRLSATIEITRHE
jgi:transglutaminase-like putative cysteine protease